MTQEARISSKRQALLEQLLKKKGVKTTKINIPRQTGDRTKFITSFAQQRLWLLDQLEPNNPAYNMPVAARLYGPLNVVVLEQSLDEIVRRHESLRTTFAVIETETFQVISPTLHLQLSVVELGELADSEREARVQQLMTEEAQRPFDLAHGPLVRATLLRLDPLEHVLLFTMHHTISDGWSCSIMVQEVAALYEAGTSGQPVDLPELPIQYADYAVWQRELLQGAGLERHLAYWREKLVGAPPKLDMPIDYPRPAKQDFHGQMREVVVSNEYALALNEATRRYSGTLFMTLLAGLAGTLWRWSEQADLVVGTVVANRERPETARLVGCLINFLPLRVKLEKGVTWAALLEQVQTVVRTAYIHQDCPFDEIVTALKPERSLAHNPVYNVGFLFQNFPQEVAFSQTLSATFLPPNTEAALLDLRFIVNEHPQGLVLSCEYRTDLFSEATIDRLLDAYTEALSQLVATPNAPVEQFVLPEALQTQAAAARERERRWQLAVSATFTAEPIADALNFWLAELALKAQIEFAAYNQVFQELLDPESLLNRNTDGVNLLLVRPEDWASADLPTSKWLETLERNAQDLVAVVGRAAGRSAAPYLVVLCPASPIALSDHERATFLGQLESRLTAELSAANGVFLLTSAQLQAQYPLAEYADPHADALGHVPYTSSGFTALGTFAMRAIAAIRRAPYKVLVLDCDQTLWGGVCGEDGAQGVRLDPPYQALQAFALQQREAGMLVCLCSKNAENDVREVFAQRDDMILKWEHLAGWRLNWESKAENLKELANELSLGLDSFIFVDDNPVECAAMSAACPEVLTLQLPEVAEQIPGFLKNVWAFDQLKATAEDRQRAERYAQNRDREQFRQTALSLEQFLAGLELKVQIRELAESELERAAQLTQRTNQFNLTTRRRTAGEIGQSLQAGALIGYTVDVSDRFGDYGLVGLMLAKAEGDALVSDTFLLSCRVLGRGVEHRMAAHLGWLAHERKLAFVELPYQSTAKNRPALNFLESLPDASRDMRGDTDVFGLSVTTATNLIYRSDGDVDAWVEKQPREGTKATTNFVKHNAPVQRERRIALELGSVTLIHRQIEASLGQRVRPGQADEMLAPGTPVEEILVDIWKEVLRLEQVSVHDDFFTLGGHSLLATQVISRLRQVLKVELPLSSLFESPRLEDLAVQVEGRQRAQAGLSVPPILSVAHNSELPLSFAQQRLWFLDQLEPGNAAYNIPAAVRLTGSLDRVALEQSLNAIIQRHAVLRTTFTTQAERPIQVVASQLNLNLSMLDLSELGETEQSERVRVLAQAEASQPFNLSTGPLVRATLLRLESENHIFLLTMHHSISDGWSIGILVRELSALYRGYVTGQAVVLPDLPVQYADFSIWQRGWLQGEILETQLAYWKQQLAGTPPILELLSDKPRPPMPSLKGNHFTQMLPRPLLDGIHALSRKEGVTPFMTLLATFQTLLYRYTGQADFVVGTPIANRNYAEIESLIGFFVNTLALRADLSGNPTFRNLLQRTRETTLGAYMHQDMPFEMLIEALNVPRNLGHTPLFQVMFVLQNAPMQAIDLPDLRLNLLDVESGATQFDLTLSLTETEQGLFVNIEYSTDLFEADTIQRLSKHYEILLTALVANPEQRISALPLLTETEQQQLLVEWNATETEYPQEQCIHELFEAQVEKTPEAVAIVFEDRQLTYRELNARANQLAHYLRSQGVGLDVLVGICVERSLEMIVGLLGILKAGGAYLPLDPAYPQERLKFMIEDGSVRLVLTQAALRKTIEQITHDILCLDSDWQQIAIGPTSNLAAQVDAQNLAYIIYTSGSTGVPKGVAATHRNVLRLILPENSYARMAPDEVFLQFAPLAFDASTFEIWGSLLNGARLVIFSGYLPTPSELADFIHTYGVTTLWLTAGLFHQMVDDAPKGMESIRQLLAGGDVLSVPHLLKAQKLWPACRLINGYGPTESITFTCCYNIADGLGASASIGQPIANTQVYILDSNLLPVVVGVAGELYIAGDGLARGYLNRPDLTAEKFIPNPFVKEDHGLRSTVHGRMYRTGDLARWLPDGNIEYLGRMDQQVKIRGFRIELGEIEAVIDQHPAVQTTVVIAREDIPGDKRLVAYLISDIATDRVSFQGSCQVEVDGEDVRSVSLEDISCNGACLGDVPDTWEVGQIFHINVSLLPTLMTQRLPGEVVWKKDNRVGILFEISLADREVLRQHIAHFSKTKDYTVMDLRHLSPRVPLQEAGLVKWDDNEVLEIITEDVSWSGACIKGLPGLDKHQGKHLRLKLPFGSDGVWLDSKLIWQRDEYAGVHFVETTPDVQALLHKTIGEILISSNPSIAQLTTYLREHLPHYMIPSAFVFLDALPLTPNGKIDRKALPAPDMTRSESGYVAPRTPKEETLAAIWADVLNLDKVGIHDNFFELGGHSLLAITLIERMRQVGFSADVRTLFSTPTIVALAAAVEIGGSEVDVPPNGIPAGCQVITPDMLPLTQLSVDEIAQIVKTVPGGAANIQDIYPLAPLQEGILFHHLMSQEGDAYILPSLLSFDSRERLERFVNALQVVINRHDILRTAVVWDGVPQPVQVVWRQAPVSIEEVSFDVDNGEIAQQISARYDPRHTRLDVRQAPMLRCFMTEDRPNERWLLEILAHHLVIDHTTLDLIIAEIQTILQGREEDLPTTFPFRNFVAQARLGISQAEHEAFFSKMLSHVDEPTAPFGLLDVQGDGSGIEDAWRKVDSELARRLRQQARRLGVGAASLMHLAWAQVLARTTGREDVVFGTVLFGRMQGGAGADRVMGMFINTLPVCIPIGEMNVQESVRQTHQRLTELLRHEHASLALAQRSSGVQAPAPLFSALLNYRHSANAEVAAQTWEGMQVFSGEERTNYPLTLSVDDLGEDFALTAQVVASVKAQRICDYMHTALEHLADALENAPQTATNQIEVLPLAERNQLLVEWNATEMEYAQGQCIHELFEAQAEKTPEAVAVVFGDQQITYRELNARANQLAHYLRSQGVGPDVLVGICVERSLEMMVGLLGILKAGGAYVPLDPAYPQERLAYMLQDTRPAVLLTQQSLQDTLLIAGFCLDSQWDTLSSYAHTNLENSTLPGNLAYVIYTSGSTGRPKGSLLTHANVARLFSATDAWFEFDENDTWTMFHSYAFDFSVWEIWGALLYGGKLIIVPYLVSRSPDLFLTLLAQEKVTVLNQTPSAFQQLVESDLKQAVPALALRKVIFGGEALNQVALAPWFDRHGYDKPNLINMYGITETTVHVTYHPLQVDERHGSSIGRPIPDLGCYLLDANLNPVPVGVPGELCVTGDGLARGYLNRPDLTANKFIPHPFSNIPGARMYRSGDLARYLPNGEIEYLGRIDSQIKIRGFRIELGEIEAALASQPEVREAVVLAREDMPGDKHLVGYLVAQAGCMLPESAALRSALSKSLPDYMLPAHFVHLDALPLTPNGKIDRKALPAPDMTRSESGYVAPRTPKEETLAGIWADVLNLDKVGIHDNFFELGGHSLLAIKLIERMRQVGFSADVRTLFSTPTIVALAAAVEIGGSEVDVPPNGIPEGCQAITPDMLPLTQLSVEEIAQIVKTVPGGAANIQDIYPLAPLQEGILFHHLMSQEGDAYLLPSLLSFDSRERLERFVNALQVVINRHDILRTAVVWDGVLQPVQVVWRQAPVSIEEVSFDVDNGEIAEQISARYDPRHTRLDVRQAPMLRGFIAEDAANERWLLEILAHHLVIDHTTLDLIIAEIQTILQGREEDLPTTFPFRNFVAQARLGISQAEHEAFFSKMLSHVDEPTAPFGLLDVQGDGSGIEEARRTVDSELAGRLRQQARRLGVGAASLMHLAWAQVLARTTGREDVVFGTVLFGRMQGGSGADRVMGMFINTLPVCIPISEMNVQESVRQTHQRLTELLRHEHASLALAQRSSGVQAPAPLFSALLNYRHSATGITAEAAAQTWEGMQILSGEERTNYPLTLSVDDLGEEFMLTAQVVASVKAQRICDYMHTTLEHLADALENAPQTAANQIEVLPLAERNQLLVEWNATEAVYPQGECIHQLFESQVQKTPEAVAVVFGDQQITYRELNARANQLAHYLRSQGVGPDVLVSICVERSLEMVIGLLGILKAGGAYVPLDPAYPQERLTYMLQDTRPAVLLTQQHLLEVIPVSVTNTLCLDGLWATLERYPDSNPANITLPGNLAYVIYTSGSTGKPKGVQVAHRNLLASTVARINYYTSFGRYLLLSSLSFDSSVAAVFGTLLSANTLVLPDESSARDPFALCELIQAAHITTLLCVPSLYAELLRIFQSNGVRWDLARVIVAGEACPPELLRASHEHFPETQLFNEYGPTEGTVWATVYQSLPQRGQRSVPIGRPIANAQIYILDTGLNLVPAGVSGELHLAGDGLTRGYLRRPELTAEKFIPNPFVKEDGGQWTVDGRMYRTGDLARYLPDGNIEFLGRVDHQVKIRGFRIELGEIESALAGHPDILENVVIAREDTPGNKRLVAYLVSQQKPDLTELRDFLKAGLPDYMLPSAFVFLDRLPLTLNGKVNRKVLPAPDMEYSGVGYVAPRTTTEATLAQIWADVLKLEQVGIHDNFFELGGHSLLATQIISRLRAAFQIELPLRALFESSTVESLAPKVEQAQQEQGQMIAPAIIPVARTEVLPLSFAQQRMWFLDQFDPGGASFNMPTALRLKGDLNVDALRRALNEIVRRHESLRTTFAVVDGAPVQVIVEQLELALPLTDLTGLPLAVRESKMRQLAQDEAEMPFNLLTGPLIRASLIHLEPTEHIILLTLHHIISDGWSMSVLVNEVAALYGAYVQNQPSPLPELAIQFADFAYWQRQRLSGDVLQQQLDYWVEQLSGIPSLLMLPTDHPRPAIQNYYGATLPFVISAKTTAALRALNKQTQTTLFMTLTAALNILLSRYSRQNDICIGTPIANRNRAEVEPLIGCFLNTPVLRTQIDDTESFSALLQQVRTTTLDAYAHHDMSFEQLLDVIKPERNTSYSPLFQVMLILQNTPTSNFNLPGLTMQMVDVENNAAKFDLTLTVVEGADELLASLEYNTDLFDRTTIERMSGHFTRLLEAAVAHPEMRIQDLPMLNAEELHQLLVEWNLTTAAYSQGECIHELFEAQVQKTPEAIAVVFEDQTLTYAELNARSNQLAHYLRRLGVGSEALVGICVERSLEMMVGLLGILKSGAAYVPFNIKLPHERLTSMIQDTGLTVLLTQDRLRTGLPDFDGTLICLDGDWEKDIAVYPTSNLRAGVGLDDPAYVIYTSGSTGQPKGVVISQRALINYTQSACRTFNIVPSDHVLQFASISFDAAAEEIYPCLVSGATLVLRTEAMLGDAPLFFKACTDWQITVLDLPTAYWHELVSTLKPDVLPPSLRLIILGGEQIMLERIVTWQKIFADRVRLVNTYGPTEATIVATFHDIPLRAVAETANVPIPIGRPVSNAQIYILDKTFQPVPVGVPGELHIGGVGIARGYLNRPDLTAEKFIPNPFLREDGGQSTVHGRMYRTGDLARYLPDGNIEFLGRIDHQVKIRGFRIELGEIEAALAKHPAVQNNVVLAREDTPGEKRLVAYVVPRQAAMDSNETVGDQLSNEQVTQWQTLFDDTYSVTSPTVDPTFIIYGWNSSYTGEALPVEEMHEWVEQTVARIIERKPGRVLEIGCGSGLQLFRVAPHSEAYWGTDISKTVLARLQKNVDESEIPLPPVTLLQRAADNFDGIPAHSFDTIIINSVIQYFPNADYLVTVLEKSVQMLRPGGRIFIGDVRSLPLLEAFHASVEFSKTSGSVSTSQLQSRVQKRLEQEQELVVDPALFLAFKAHVPAIRRVDVQIKRAHDTNEMTCFRYDVVLDLEGESSPVPQPQIRWLDWEQEKLTLVTLRQRLEETPDILGVKGIPNARLTTERQLLELLESPQPPADVAGLRDELQNHPLVGLYPETLWALGEELSYQVQVSYSSPGDDFRFSVLFQKYANPEDGISAFEATFDRAEPSPRPWSTYANHPLSKKLTQQLVAELRDHLKENLPEYMIPANFVFLERLPLTINGKINHKALPAPDTIRTEVGYVAPRTTAEETLAQIWAEVLKLDKVGIHDNFFELGGDSILSIQIVSRANQAGYSLTSKHIFQSQTIAELAAIDDVVTAVQAEQGLVTGTGLLTPIQHRFFEQNFSEPNHFNLSLFLEATEKIDFSLLEETVRHLLRHHDALRLRFSRTNPGGWLPTYADLETSLNSCLRVDMSTMPVAEQDQSMEVIASVMQSKLNLTDGPMMLVVLFDLGDGRADQLLWVCHPLLMDETSWRILLEDFQTIYTHLRLGQAVTLPAKTTSYKDWAESLAAYARSISLDEESLYWTAKSRAQVASLPVDVADAPEKNIEALAQRVTVSLSASETQMLLQEVPQAYGVQMADVLLTALGVALVKWTGTETCLIDVEKHDRESMLEEIDLSRTVGWFTNIFPLFLDLQGASDPRQALKLVKQRLQNVPNQGIGYGLLRYLSENDDVVRQLQKLPQAEICFNYIDLLGATLPNNNSLFQIIPKASGVKYGLHNQQSHRINVEGAVDDDKLEMRWSYSAAYHHVDTIERIAQNFMNTLQWLIAERNVQEIENEMQSGLFDVDLNQEDLENILTEIDFSSEEN